MLRKRVWTWDQNIPYHWWATFLSWPILSSRNMQLNINTRSPEANQFPDLCHRQRSKWSLIVFSRTYSLHTGHGTKTEMSLSVTADDVDGDDVTVNTSPLSGTLISRLPLTPLLLLLTNAEHLPFPYDGVFLLPDGGLEPCIFFLVLGISCGTFASLLLPGNCSIPTSAFTSALLILPSVEKPAAPEKDEERPKTYPFPGKKESRDVCCVWAPPSATWVGPLFLFSPNPSGSLTLTNMPAK